MGDGFSGRRVEFQPLGGGAVQDYQVVEEIARGGMGVVYRAFDPRSQRDVAIKIVQSERVNPVQIQRFLREGEITARLDHPGILRVHAAGTLNGRPALVYELVEGAQTLSDAFRTAPLPRRLELVRDVAAALGYAHQQGIVHRDVKPDNVLIDGEGRARVADFGLASAQHLSRLTTSGTTMGTLQYMSPEQFEGERDRVGPASDVWSLGVVLYEALAGRPPFEGENVMELAAQLADGPQRPPSAHAHTPEVTKALDAVCMRALRTEPDERYPDGAALAADLQACLEGKAPTALSNRRAPALAAAAALVGALAVVALVRGGLRDAPQPTPATPASPARGEASPEPSTDPEADAPSPPPTLGRGFDVSVPEAKEHPLAVGPDAVWIGGPGYLLRHARQEDELDHAERLVMPGLVAGLACLGSRLWLLYVDQETLHAATLEGDAVRDVWTAPGSAARGGKFCAWEQADGAVRLLVATGSGVWLLRVGDGAQATQALKLDCPVDWIRGALHLPDTGQVAVCGNGGMRLMGFVGVYDDQQGQLAWYADVRGTVGGLARGYPGEILTAVRETRAVLRLDANTLPSNEPATVLPLQHTAPVRDVLRGGEWVISIAADSGVGELDVRDGVSLERQLRERVLRAAGGSLCWDPVWGGVWISTSRRALWRPLTRAD